MNRVYARTRTCTRPYVYAHTHAHTHTRTRTHAHTHTHAAPPRSQVRRVSIPFFGKGSFGDKELPDDEEETESGGPGGAVKRQSFSYNLNPEALTSDGVDNPIAQQFERDQTEKVRRASRVTDEILEELRMEDGDYDREAAETLELNRLVVGEYTARLPSASCCFLLLPVSPARLKTLYTHSAT